MPLGHVDPHRVLKSVCGVILYSRSLTKPALQLFQQGFKWTHGSVPGGPAARRLRARSAMPANGVDHLHARLHGHAVVLL